MVKVIELLDFKRVIKLVFFFYVFNLKVSSARKMEAPMKDNIKMENQMDMVTMLLL